MPAGCAGTIARRLRDIDDGKAAARIAAGIASAKTVAAVVNLARADVRHATAPEDWDADPWALNTPEGIVDLRSGRMFSHDRAVLCSKITAVAPTEADCPRWRRFLDEVTDGDQELQGSWRESLDMVSPARRGSTRCSSSTAPAPTARAPSSTR